MQVTGASRRLAIWGAVMAAAVMPTTALAQGDGGRHDRHPRHGGGDGLTVVGRAMSRGDGGVAGLQIRAHRSDDSSDEPGESTGWVRFGQRTPDGGMALEGEVTCLLRNADGVVHVTGTVHRGGTHRHHGDGAGGGGELAGRDFAFTIDVPGDPQHFSPAKVAEAGALAACSGGDGSLEVTRGGFRTTQAEGGSSDRPSSPAERRTVSGRS